MVTRVRHHRVGRLIAATAARAHVHLLAPVRAHPVLGKVYRVVVGLFGLAIVILGIVLIPAPGPGWLIVLSGLWVLASEFPWARRLLDVTRRFVRRWTRWALTKPLWLRSVFGLAGLAFLATVVVLSLRAAAWSGFPFD